jgi:hypothetical protein
MSAGSKSGGELSYRDFTTLNSVCHLLRFVQEAIK